MSLELVNTAPSFAERVLQGLQAQAAPGGGGAITQVLFFAGFIAIMYFLLIRPQQKQAKQHRAMVAALKKGDAVVTSGGILGRIYSVHERYVMLEVGRDTRFRVLTSAISGKAPEGLFDETGEASKTETKSEK